MPSKHLWPFIAVLALSASYVAAQPQEHAGQAQKPPEQKPPPPKPAPKPPEQKPAEKPQGDKPVTTQPGRATPPTRGNPQDERVDTALDQLSAKIQAHQVQKTDYDAVREALRQGRVNETGAMDPVAQNRLQRLEQTIDSFDARQQNQKLTSAHVDELRRQVIDERLDDAVDRWSKAAAAGKVTDAEYTAVAAQLKHRAEVAASFDPEAAAMNTRLQAHLQELQTRGATAPVREQDVAEFRRELFDQRLEHALAGMETRARNQDLTRAEMADVRGLINDRAANATGDPQFADMHKRLSNALDALDQKVATGQVDPNEVAKLRATLIHHAREAGSPQEPAEKPAKPPTKPGGE